MAAPEHKILPIASIRLDFQPPEHLDAETVEEYLLSIQSGEAIEPVFVRFDGAEYWLQDGFHRVEASLRAGRTQIVAEVSPGGLAEMESEWQCYLVEVKKMLRS